MMYGSVIPHLIETFTSQRVNGYGSITVIARCLGLVIQIKICAKYRDMQPRPRLVCQEPGMRLLGRSPGVPDKSSRGLGSMSRYSAQILICFITYIFLKYFHSSVGLVGNFAVITVIAVCVGLVTTWKWLHYQSIYVYQAILLAKIYHIGAMLCTDRIKLDRHLMCDFNMTVLYHIKQFHFIRL